MIVLLDTGNSHTMIKQTRSLPHGTSLSPSLPKRTTTINGVYSTSAQVTLSRVKFPEFGNPCIEAIFTAVFDSPTCRYDMILGRDILQQMGATIDYKARIINWMNRDLPMKDLMQSPLQPVPYWEYHLLQEEAEDYFLLFKTYADDVLIKDWKYQAVLPEEVV